MKMELSALKGLLSQADQILATAPVLPQNRTKRCREILTAAMAITDDLLKEAKAPSAVTLGRKGGQSIAKRGIDYFRQLAAKRKTRAGGRPKSDRDGK
jgi:hypothetical protein